LTSKREQFYKRRIAELEKQVAELLKVNAELAEKVAKLSKNSSNSSKPPSSDIVKPQRNTKSNTPRKIGAQPGHTKHERPLFTTEEIDDFQTNTLDACPDCGGILALVKDANRVVQQVEIVEKPVNIEQHTSLCYSCEHCQKFHYAPMPANIEKGQPAGPHLTAIVAYMKGACHRSFSTIRKFLRNMFSIFHKAEELTENTFTKAMDESRKTFLDIAVSNVPESRLAQNPANRFRKHGEVYFRFITTPGIEPTNNLAEQAIRFVVIDRYITQGTRSEKGRVWCERIWTVLATCASPTAAFLMKSRRLIDLLLPSTVF